MAGPNNSFIQRFQLHTVPSQVTYLALSLHFMIFSLIHIKLNGRFTTADQIHIPSSQYYQCNCDTKTYKEHDNNKNWFISVWINWQCPSLVNTIGLWKIGTQRERGGREEREERGREREGKRGREGEERGRKGERKWGGTEGFRVREWSGSRERDYK